MKTGEAEERHPLRTLGTFSEEGNQPQPNRTRITVVPVFRDPCIYTSDVELPTCGFLRCIFVPLFLAVFHGASIKRTATRGFPPWIIAEGSFGPNLLSSDDVQPGEASRRFRPQAFPSRSVHRV